MQLLLIRHALPLRSAPGEGADPPLSATGREQAARLPAALARFPVTRLVSSPQRRAVQTAEPVAAALGLDIEIDDRLAEYDRDLPDYVPVEQLRTEHPEAWARMVAGQLPEQVDAAAFTARVDAALAAVVAAADTEQTVAVVSHGGVINATLHAILHTDRLLAFRVDYASVTRLLYSRTGRASVVAVNGTEHVWDLLSHHRPR